MSSERQVLGSLIEALELIESRFESSITETTSHEENL